MVGRWYDMVLYNYVHLLCFALILCIKLCIYYLISSFLRFQAWNLWNEDNILSLIDPAIFDSATQAEILRCIHVGLLSLQEFPEDRPSITTVVSMIESEVTDLPRPTQPGFTQRRIASLNGTQQNGLDCYSVNGVSITSLGGR